MSTSAAQTKYISFDNVLDQHQSVLFQLPGEVRQNILYYVLASFEDKSRTYNKNTYWSRPHYLAPRRSDTALLRCCKRVYNESWFIPFAAAEHTFWLSSVDRAPLGAIGVVMFERILKQVHMHHGDVEIDHVRFFAQMWAVEPGNYLQPFLDLPNFHPRYITLTIRHTDWWLWESDDPLRIGARWVNQCKFPADVRQFRMELESLERKKDQVDSIVRQMKEHWCFKRSDGVLLSAKHTEVGVTRWKGTSTWRNQRWIRDETAPEMLDYYIATVTWQHEPDVDDDGAYRPDLVIDIPHQRLPGHLAYLDTRILDQANIPPGCSAQETLTRFHQWRDQEPLRVLAAAAAQPHDVETDQEGDEVFGSEGDGDDGDDDDDNDSDSEDLFFAYPGHL